VGFDERRLSYRLRYTCLRVVWCSDPPKLWRNFCMHLSVSLFALWNFDLWVLWSFDQFCPLYPNNMCKLFTVNWLKNTTKMIVVGCFILSWKFTNRLLARWPAGELTALPDWLSLTNISCHSQLVNTGHSSQCSSFSCCRLAFLPAVLEVHCTYFFS